MIKTYQYRIKDKNRLVVLNKMKRDVNFVWNVLNSASRKVWKESRKYFHKFDPYFTAITKGASSELSIHSQTIQAVSEQFHKDIRQQKKQLRYKSRKTRGWVPFKISAIKLKDDGFIYCKKYFKIWKSRNFPHGFILKTGSFSQDSLGRWYVNFTVEYNENLKCGIGKIGIDLGMKVTATCSDGEALNLKTLEKIDKKIAKQQQARNFKRVKKLHIYKANKRKDKICKFVKGLVNKNDLIAIGDVKGFTKGVCAKSRYNNAWSLFKKWANFKCLEYGTTYKEVSEHLTTQRCNKCGKIAGPKGVKGLSVRFWECSCGARLNRDVNAAVNILNVALGT